MQEHGLPQPEVQVPRDALFVMLGRGQLLPLQRYQVSATCAMGVRGQLLWGPR